MYQLPFDPGLYTAINESRTLKTGVINTVTIGIL